MKTSLELIAEYILKNGPDRVVIDAQGDSVNPKLARMMHKLKPDIIFIRRDGWSLGAPEHLANVAYGLWLSEWIAFMRRPERIARPIREYHA